MKSNKTMIDPKGNEVDVVYINFFGYPMWFGAHGFTRFCKNVYLVAQIDRRARRAKNQLLKIQKLVDAINDEYYA